MQHTLIRVLSATLMGMVATPLLADVVVLDDFEDGIGAWQTHVPEGVSVRIAPDAGKDGGTALRIDVNFETGGGFAIVRLPVSLELTEDFRFDYDLRADIPRNNLEFKLLDASLENVWWVNRPRLDFPNQWEHVRHRKRAFEFAWGPRGPVMHERLGAIEIAIASAEGGQGSVWIDNLEFRSVPPVAPYRGVPRAFATSATEPGWRTSRPAPEHSPLRWRSEPDDGSPTLTIDFGQPREWSALLLQWDDDLRPRSYDVEVRSSDGTWETVATRDAPGAGIVERIWMPDTVSSTIRIRASNDADTGIELESYSVVDVDAAQDQDGLVRTIASRTRGAWFPEYYHGRQAFWTVVGTPESEYEALLNEYGAIEPQAGGWRIEPFILSDGIMLTRRNAQLSQHLLDGDLPIPSVVREHDGLRLEITALAVDASGPALLARYRVTNTGDTSRDATLFLCARPFQVLPPWQRLNVIGGVAKTHSVQCSARQMIINDRADVTAWMPADSWGASSFADGEIVERLAMGHTPGAAAQDPTGLASGALGYQLELAPGASQDVVVELAMSREPRQAYSGGDAARFEQILQQERSRWRSLLDRFDIVVPPEARWLIDTMKSNVAYVLINMDGPAIQPGSRTYERSWIRDGSLTGTALLATGHAERMQAFLDWFGPHQFPSGKIPCVVDARGPDPFDEHDSTGQYIYAVSQLYRFSGDRSVLENHWERVLAGVAYLQELREQRLTPEYDTPELIAYRGLVPESASHEGYMSDPMHSYWDGFFVVRGLHDAAFMARELGETQEATRIEKLAHDALTSLDESLTAAMAMHDIGYLPGCVELGDFDATSTAIGLFPCDVIPFIQTEATYFTFDRYWRRFKQRAVDAIEWRDYTPYEVRIIGAFVRLGQPERARALAEWFRLDQHPKGWNHWAEVAYQDDRLPAFIGDMPHTWVGSDFINAARSLFVYERETDETLVLGAGLDLEWITSEQGVSVNIPTAYGRLSYRCEGTARRIDFIISGDVPAPPGGLRLRPPRPDHVERVVIDGTPHRPPANGEIELRGGHAARVTVEYVQR